MFVRECFTQIRQVELAYLSVRTFIFFKNRLSGEEWEKEQEKDECGAGPVTLATIEDRVPDSPMEALRRNEYGRRSSRQGVSDMDVCRLIDEEYVGRHGSVYLLPERRKAEIAESLYMEHGVSRAQSARCLAVV